MSPRQTRPIRVLQVITTFGTGGTEQGIINIVNRLQGSGIESELCLFMWVGADESLAKIEVPDFKVHCLEKRFGNDPRVPLRLARLLRTGKYDVVHSRGWPTYLEMAAAGFIGPRTPAVHSEHGTSFLDAGRRRNAYSMLSRRWKKFLFVSHRLRDEFRAGTRIPAEKMTVIPNGVDFARFAEVAPDPAQAEHFPSDWFHVGTAGRLHEVKNHHLLLEVARLAKERGKRWRVHIAGDGAMRSSHESFLAQHELRDHVVLHGTLARVEQLYARLDLFALTSRSEGHPNALLEALATGLPVVSTPVGDVPHFLRDGENGFVIPQDDAEALYAVIDRVASDRDALARLAEVGHADAKATFDIDVMVASYADLYRELAGVPTEASQPTR